MIDNTNVEKTTQDEVKYRNEQLFLERFNTLLENAGLTQSKLAEQLETTRQYIWGIAHAREIPTTAMKVRIAKALGTDTIVIWGNGGEQNE